MYIRRWLSRLIRSIRLKRRDGLFVVLGALLTLLVFGIISLMHTPPTPLAFKTTAISSPWIPSTVTHWQDPINDMAQKYNLDPTLLAIIMTLESGGYDKADSGEAQGLMQITPLTAKDIAAKFLKKPTTKYDIWNPRTNIEFGAAYLAYLRDQFGTAAQGPTWNETVELIAAGYNGGPGAANNLEQGHGLEDTQTLSYSRDAFNMWRERHNTTSPTYNRWLERGGTTLINLAKN